MIEVPYKDLVPAEDNVRDTIDDVDDLAASIAETGLQQPLKVQATDDGKYLIIAGHRRHAAIGQLREAGNSEWKRRSVPCVLNGQLDDDGRVAAMLVENLQRRDLNPMEEATAFTRLVKEFRWNAATIAQRIGRSVDYVNVRLRLVRLPDVAATRLRDGTLPLATAVALSAIKNPDEIARLLNNGRVPGQYDIADAVNNEKCDDLIAKFQRKFDELEVQVSPDRPPHYRHTFWAAANPKAVSLIEGTLPKTAKAYLIVNRRLGTVEAIIARELTDKERDKLWAEQAAATAKAKADVDAKADAERAAEQAQWSPEFKAFKAAQAEWNAECLRIREANDEAERVALLRWARGKKQSDLIKTVCLDVLEGYGEWMTLAKTFGLYKPTMRWDDAQEAVLAHVNTKAELLYAAVALVLAPLDEERETVTKGAEVQPLPDEPQLADFQTADSEESAASAADDGE